jgi:hypothetical protein
MFMMSLIVALDPMLRVTAVSLRRMLSRKTSARHCERQPSNPDLGLLDCVVARAPRNADERREDRLSLSLRDRLQALEGQALRIPDARKIKPANEGCDHVTVAIGQRDNGINGNSLGVHLGTSGFFTRSQNLDRLILGSTC